MAERFDEPELTNPRAERVRSVKALAKRSVRVRTKRFLVEGPQSVREAIAYHNNSGPLRGSPIEDLYATKEFVVKYPQVVDQALARGVRCRTATPEVLDVMADTPANQGVVAVSRTIDVPLNAVTQLQPRLIAVLAHVRDPGNAGTILRAADAAGADAVVLTDESVEVYNPKLVRSTAGSLFHVPIVVGVPLAEVMGALRSAGLSVLAADGSGRNDLDELLDYADRARYQDVPVPSKYPRMADPTAWIFGNEAWGLQPEHIAAADHVVRIPIHGTAESLNVGVAAAICLYASARAQR